MQKTVVSSYSHAAKVYYSLTKPGIISGNIMTMAGGFALASKGEIDFLLFAAALMGLICVIGSACAFNNYIDREVDGKMARTRNRPLANGEIPIRKALIFASTLGVLGVLVLTLLTNPLTVLVALFGFTVYVVFYSFSKYRSVHSTLIGSIAGAVPPVIGYCAVSNSLDPAAWILFAIMVMWQMPHFFAIAIYRMQDYLKAGIPLLPIKKGLHRTKVQMLLYIIGFMAASSMLPLFHYTGLGFLAIALPLSLIWLVLCLQGFKAVDDTRWARKMFLFSLLIVTVEFISIPLI